MGRYFSLSVFPSNIVKCGHASVDILLAVFGCLIQSTYVFYYDCTQKGSFLQCITFVYLLLLLGVAYKQDGYCGLLGNHCCFTSTMLSKNAPTHQNQESSIAPSVCPIDIRTLQLLVCKGNEHFIFALSDRSRGYATCAHCTFSLSFAFGSIDTKRRGRKQPLREQFLLMELSLRFTQGSQ